MTHADQQNDGAGNRQIGIQKSGEVSVRLAGAARLLRKTTSSRSNLFKVVGLRPSLLDLAYNALSIAILIVVLILPTIITIAYYGFIASDQYQTETRFIVRSSTPALGTDQFGEATGIPSAKIVQDTQVVFNFIESHEMLDVLEKSNIDLRRIFGSEEIDWWARLPEDASREDLLEYWKGMINASISPSSGIITITVRAFKPEDAVTLANSIVSASEKVVNRVNDRIWADVIATSNANLENAKKQLLEARQALANARNRDGILSVEGSSEIIANLISSLETERLSLQHRYDANLSVVSDKAPQMLVLKREIEAKEKQIAELKGQLAGSNDGARDLADVSQEMSQLQLAQSLAEQQFSSSLQTVEKIQFVSRQQLLYLESFLDARVPDEALYPKRLLLTILIILGCLILYGTLIGLLYVARNKIAN